ncbi:MAG: hypothetical protein MZV64_18835 [Ignavibacteriales bacterium]|nr:hypothetical protein [Ignavibacteriales bacterium]
MSAPMAPATPGDVVVDSGRDADDREAVPLGQDPGPRERAVAADNDQPVDRPPPEVGQGRLLPLLGVRTPRPGPSSGSSRRAR